MSKEADYNYLVELGLTPEEAGAIARSWSYQQPQDPAATVELAHNASHAEEQRRGEAADRNWTHLLDNRSR